MAPSCILQIFLWITIQDQIRIAQWVSSSTQPVSMLNLQILSSYFMFVSFQPYGTFTVVTFVIRSFF